MSGGVVVQFRSRRSLRWQSLSLAARAVVLELVAEMRQHGATELPLGGRGLAAVARLLGCEWAELEPALLEALASGKLAYDADRQVIVDGDPSPAAPAVLEEAAPVSTVRPSSSSRRAAAKPVSPAAERKRRSRARRAAEAARQLDLDGVDTVTCHAPSALGHTGHVGARDSVTDAHEVPSISGDRACDQRDMSRSPLSLSPSQNTSTEAERAPRDRVTLSAYDLPLGWFDFSATVRPDLPAEIVRESWEAFVDAKRTRELLEERGCSWNLVQRAWKRWLQREQRSAAPPPAPAAPAPAAPPVAPYHRPAPVPQPDVERPAIPPARRPMNVRDDAERAALTRGLGDVLQALSNPSPTTEVRRAS